MGFRLLSTNTFVRRTQSERVCDSCGHKIVRGDQATFDRYVEDTETPGVVDFGSAYYHTTCSHK